MNKEDSLVVNEIYASIQGESTFAGISCTFIRLTGCNLRCSWCDTAHAFYEGARLSRHEVLQRALAYQTPLVELTGGEPLLQPGSIPLLTELCDSGRRVLLETSGERDISSVDSRVHRIVDLKAPGSGESQRNRLSNFEHLTHNDEIKIVIKDRTDYDWAADMIRQHELDRRVRAIHLSCVHMELAPHTLAAWIMRDRIPARLQLQLHKYIWPGASRGV